MNHCLIESDYSMIQYVKSEIDPKGYIGKGKHWNITYIVSQWG